MAFECTPFTIATDERVLKDLKRRLEETRFLEAIPQTAWQYGADVGYMKELVDYWRAHFDWRAQEALVNEFPHYRAVVDGVGIHFVHERGSGPDPLPLVITHGWPGSFLEMLQILPLLARPDRYGGDVRDSFDVVVPSLPGYGFSDAPRQPGMDPANVAGLWVKLMRGLGYERFGAQGGDWGASVSTRIGLAFPQHLVGIHLNYIPGSYLPHRGPETPPLAAVEAEFEEARKSWYDSEGAYAHVQATRPDTLSFALNDSPVGLLAWIVEKLRDWSDCDGAIERRFTKDVILSHVTLYWTTRTVASANRLYFEARRNPLHFKPGERVSVPCGIASFPKEMPRAPRPWVERGYNVVHWSEMPRGGHFAAMEEPGLLADDIRKFFRPFRALR